MEKNIDKEYKTLENESLDIYRYLEIDFKTLLKHRVCISCLAVFLILDLEQ